MIKSSKMPATDASAWVIKVHAGEAEGKPVWEELPARQLHDGSFQLLASPGLALNLAKGDIISISDANQPAIVLRRGGNFCIQLYNANIDDASLAQLETDILKTLGGALDGHHNGNIAISVPASAGFDAINQFFDAYIAQTNVQWYFGNIYKNFSEINDTSLLNWWLPN